MTTGRQMVQIPFSAKYMEEYSGWPDGHTNIVERDLNCHYESGIDLASHQADELIARGREVMGAESEDKVVNQIGLDIGRTAWWIAKEKDSDDSLKRMRELLAQEDALKGRLSDVKAKSLSSSQQPEKLQQLNQKQAELLAELHPIQRELEQIATFKTSSLSMIQELEGKIKSLEEKHKALNAGLDAFPMSEDERVAAEKKASIENFDLQLTKADLAKTKALLLFSLLTNNNANEVLQGGLLARGKMALGLWMGSMTGMGIPPGISENIVNGDNVMVASRFNLLYEDPGSSSVEAYYQFHVTRTEEGYHVALDLNHYAVEMEESAWEHLVQCGNERLKKATELTRDDILDFVPLLKDDGLRAVFLVKLEKSNNKEALRQEALRLVEICYETDPYLKRKICGSLKPKKRRTLSLSSLSPSSSRGSSRGSSTPPSPPPSSPFSPH